MGLLIGVEFKSAKYALATAKEMIQEGILIFPAFGNPLVLIIEPPLVISDPQVEKICEVFENACQKVQKTLKWTVNGQI